MTASGDERALAALNALVGEWTTEATHPLRPGVVVGGRVTVEWLEGGRFLIHRSWTDHPDFPDAISIIGVTDRLTMNYFDSRGVHRIYDVSVDDASWRYWRDVPGFSQRFTGTFADGGLTILGRSQLCRDDATWNDDLEITYRRAG